MEKTLVLIKPDAIANKHIGDIIKKYEGEGLKIAALKLMQMTPKVASIHYAEHVGKSFYPELVKFMTEAPIVAMVIEGEDAISRVREINGATNPEKAEAGTIRKLYAEGVTRNAVHASDSPASAEREIAIFFSKLEILT